MLSRALSGLVHRPSHRRSLPPQVQGRGSTLCTAPARRHRSNAQAIVPGGRGRHGGTGHDVGMTPRSSWYAETPALRTRQLAGDALLLLWCAVWFRVGVAVHRGVERLGGPGRELQDAGGGLRDGLSRAAERAEDVPLVGDELRSPLDAAAGAGDALVRAGQAQEAAVSRLAVLLAVVVVALPVLWALSRRLPARLAWARQARAARGLRGDVELLALRAATSRPLAELATLGPEPVGRWRRGEPGAAEALAGLELAALGLRAPPGPPARPRP